MDDLVQWLRAELEDGVERARWMGNVLITRGAPEMGVPTESAERQARFDVEAAEAKLRLFEETVRPYLGTAGPTGRIAEQQMHLLAVMFADRPGFREEWRP